MILETIFYYLGAILLNLLLVIGIIVSLYWITNRVIFNKLYWRMVYIALLLMKEDCRGIGKVFKEKNGKKYLIKVKEVKI